MSCVALFLLTIGLRATAAATAELKPKNIDISLTARWAETPLAVEAAEFMAEEGLFWRFAEALVEPPPGSSDRDVLAAVEDAAAGLLSPLRLRLLRMLLSAHVFSPRVEMWRQIGATDAARLSVPPSAATWLRACGRAHVLPADAPASDVVALADAALADARARGGACASVPDAAAERVLSDADPLSVDHVYRPREGVGDAPLVVLYAPLGSATFRAAHASLSRAATDGHIRYVLRPLAPAPQASVLGAGGVARQTLQGYGVQLAIKNMEYKAMDDQELASLAGLGGEADGGAAEDDDDGHEAHGFYFGTLAARRPGMEGPLAALKEELDAAASSQDVSDLKVWALQDLGLQASARALSAPEPLRTLRDTCQNFPFVARSISKLRVPRELLSAVEYQQTSVWGPRFAGALLNGRALPLVEENDLAALLTTLTREMRTVDELATIGVPAQAIRTLLALPAPSASLRVASGGSPAVHLLNDVAKDRRYSRWPPSVRELLRPNPWGQISFCRRNVFTMTFALDPSTEQGRSVLGYLTDLHKQGAPIRFGLILAPGAAGGRGTVSGSAHRPPPLVQGSATRLVALESAYANPVWQSAALVGELEGRAASAAAAGGSADWGGEGGGGGVGGGSALSEEEAEEEALGVLLTKLFLFCRRKLGAGAALRFLELTREVREVGGGMFAMFGGPPQLDSLTREHLLAALEGASHAAPKKRIDAAAVFSGLSNGQLDEYDTEAALGRAFLHDRGLPTSEPLLLLNGRLVELGGQGFEQEIMASLSAEVRSVTALVRTGVLTDEANEPLEVIANATATFPRYNEALLQPPDAIELVSLRSHPALGGLRWLGTAAAAEAEVREDVDVEEDGDDAGGGEGAEEELGGSEASLWPVSQLLAVDLSVASHVALVAVAVQAMEEAAGGRVRLALLHKPAGGSDAVRHARAAAAWDAFSSHSAAPGSPSRQPPALETARRLLALLLAAAQAREAVTHPMLSELLPDIFPTTAPASPDSDAGALGDAARESHASLLDALSVQTSPAIIINGRVIRADAAAHLDAVDLGLLAEFEYRQRAQAPAAVLAPMQPPPAVDVSGVDISDHEAVSTSARAWRSDLLMLSVASLARGAREAAAGGASDTGFRGSDVECGAACVRLPGSGPGEALELVVVLDPLSKQAQRSVPVLMALQSALGLGITLHLNPQLRIDKFPLESFYRYVVSLEPSFDEAGRSRAPDADRAIFSALRTPQVLTLHVDAPEAWLLECTEAAYDMDNIRLAELGDRRTLSASYELASLLITGSCEDVRSHSPPNGLQLLLGTAATPHVTDTLVMSNLGYFQLKAAPGVWDLSLAPGPSSDVFSIQTAPLLLAAGHATRVLGAGGRRLALEPEALLPARALRVTMADFSGQNVLLLARKLPGKEAISILDDDAQAGPADSEADRAGMMVSVSKWWSSGAAATADDDATVHIFSLASGHLYERFLKIMMQSVLEKTQRRVKFWLLKNFLSPAFIGALPALARDLGFEYGLVQYQWPSWLHKQTEKQRIIWGYKILFLDVMFPLSVKRIIYIDADQVVNADVAQLWDMKLPGKAAVAMTPFCRRDANPDTTGFRFFAQGYWHDHLQGRPYHISALFVVDLHKFRRRGYGDQYRIFYDSLSKDPNSLANLDQDLPNYAQHVVPIHSLPEEWLWCETWCGNASKPIAKTIDLCNNPLTKEPKLSQATRVIGERWTRLDNTAKAIEERAQYGTEPPPLNMDSRSEPRATRSRDEL